MAAIVGDGEWIYGMQLPIQTLTRSLADPWEDAATVADLVTVAQRARPRVTRSSGCATTSRSPTTTTPPA